MNDANNNAADSAADAIGTQQTPGSILRKLREDAGLSHLAVGEALHLTVHYVKALESDDYGKLPGLTFVKGYLRSYARYLKADVAAVMASFEQYISSLVDEGQRTEQVQRSRRRHDQALRWAIATSVILVLGLAGGWWFKGKDATAAPPASIARPVGIATTQPSVAASPRSEPADIPAARVTPQVPAQGLPQSDPQNMVGSPAPADNLPAPLGLSSVATDDASASAEVEVLQPQIAANASATPAVAAESMAANENQALAADDTLTVTPAEDGSRQVRLVSGGDDLLELRFSGSSWVEIDDGANIRLYNDMLRSGDALTIHGAAPFQLLLGDAANVSVRFNSEAVSIDSVRGDSTARLVLASPGAMPGTLPGTLPGTMNSANQAEGAAL